MISKIIKSPKFMWVVGGVLVWWFFGPSIPGLIRRAFISRPSTSVQAASKDKSARAAGPSGGPAPLPASGGAGEAKPADAALHNLMGAWEGTVLLSKQGACKVRLELREDHDKQGQFLGYSNLSCTPNMLEIMAQQQPGHKMTPAEGMEIMNRSMKPSAGTFTGIADSGAIKLTASNTFGLTGLGCSIASFAVMPAGANDMGADFKENDVPGCDAGQLVMKKAR
jgi:hypothetical protein